MRKTEKLDDLTDEGRETIPRLSFWQAIPKRNLFRIVFFLAALVGIVYLQQKTSAIAGCMNETFHAPIPSQERHMSTHRLRVELIIRDASTP